MIPDPGHLAQLVERHLSGLAATAPEGSAPR